MCCQFQHQQTYKALLVTFGPPTWDMCPMGVHTGWTQYCEFEEIIYFFLVLFKFLLHYCFNLSYLKSGCLFPRKKIGWKFEGF